MAKILLTCLVCTLLYLLGTVDGNGENCPETYQYSDCGSPCTKTCDNYQNPPICQAVCSSGCFCPNGTVEHDGTCITPANCPTTTQNCPETYQYNDCGSPCTKTCDNYQNPPICQTVCRSGCFCPNGTVEHDGACIIPANCPTTTQNCPETYQYNDCGSPCTKTCDNYQNPPVCLEICSSGCFCPYGTVEHDGTCITPANCPTTTPSCGETYEYQECGSPCRKACDNRDQDIICATVCESGCFCPDGMVEHESRCVAEEECPGTCSGGKEWNNCGTACPLTCDNYKETVFCTRQCVSGCFCPIGTFDLNGVCVKNTTCESCKHCRNGQTCVGVKEDTYEYATCKDPIAVPCTDGGLPCAPASHCVTHNVTGINYCLQSCYLQNGGCSEDQVCYYQKKEDDDDECDQLLEPCFQTTCTSLPEESGNCPIGWELNQCGSLCQRSCDDYVTGSRLACPEICGPPDCVCPQGMVVFRDRCVDPLECYALLTTDPDLNPLPVSSDALLLEVTLDNVKKTDVDGAEFVEGIKQLLKEEGLDDISVTLFATLETEDGSVAIVLQFKKRRESSDGKPPAISVSPASLEQMIMENPGELNHRVAEVKSVGVRTDSEEDEESSGLSDGAVAGITVSAVVLCLGFVLAIAVTGIVLYFVLGKKNVNHSNKNKSEMAMENHYDKLDNKEEFA